MILWPLTYYVSDSSSREFIFLALCLLYFVWEKKKKRNILGTVLLEMLIQRFLENLIFTFCLPGHILIIKFILIKAE